MKILLVSISTYLPSYTGASKANRLTMEQLAVRGHDCQAITGLWHSPQSGTSRAALVDYLRMHNLDFSESGSHEIVYTFAGVEVFTSDAVDQLRRSLERQIKEFSPDWIFVSGGDPSDFLLEMCLKICPEKVIYVAHATLALPCGPGAFLPNARRTKLLRQVKGAVVPSRFIQSYLRQWADLDSLNFRFPVYGTPPYPVYDNSSDKLITLINPCAVKGISIFEELARQLPQLRFGAVPTWGTSTVDRQRLADLPNMTLLEPSENVDDIFQRVRVLLVPSLWDEAFGQVAVEAMLRGIPVIMSDVGGLPEASLGVAQVIPVQRIEKYQLAFDERYMPVPCLPSQSLEPWKEAVEKLAADSELYRSCSVRSREVALKFAEEATVDRLENFLNDLEGDIETPYWQQMNAATDQLVCEGAD